MIRTNLCNGKVEEIGAVGSRVARNGSLFSRAMRNKNLTWLRDKSYLLLNDNYRSRVSSSGAIFLVRERG